MQASSNPVIFLLFSNEEKGWGLRTTRFTEFYQHWLGTAETVDEKLATCGACSMVRLPSAGASREGFLPHLKCCTYFPFLPNFTIGALLSEATSGAGQASGSGTGSGPEASASQLSTVVRRALTAGVLTPLGLFAPRSYILLKEQLGPMAFGRSAELVCPFLTTSGDADTSRKGGVECSIWPFRPAVCASYFCQTERSEWWRRTEEFGNLFEWTLAHEVLWRIGFTSDETRRMEEIRAEASDSHFVSQAWYEHQSQAQKEELYRRCFELARQVSGAEIKALMGVHG